MTKMCEKRRETGPTAGMLCCGSPALFEIASKGRTIRVCGVHAARVLSAELLGNEQSGVRVWPA